MGPEVTIGQTKCRPLAVRKYVEPNCGSGLRNAVSRGRCAGKDRVERCRIQNDRTGKYRRFRCCPIDVEFVKEQCISGSPGVVVRTADEICRTACGGQCKPVHIDRQKPVRSSSSLDHFFSSNSGNWISNQHLRAFKSNNPKNAALVFAGIQKVRIRPYPLLRLSRERRRFKGVAIVGPEWVGRRRDRHAVEEWTGRV